MAWCDFAVYEFPSERANADCVGPHFYQTSVTLKYRYQLEIVPSLVGFSGHWLHTGRPVGVITEQHGTD